MNGLKDVYKRQTDIVQGIVILIAVYIDWFKQTGFKFSRKIKA